MSEKKMKKAPKKATKKAPVKKKTVKKAPAKKAPAKKAPKKNPAKAPEVKAPEAEGKDPASMRTMLTEALMYPPQRKSLIGSVGRGLGEVKPPSAKRPSMLHGSFSRSMDETQMTKAMHEMNTAIVQMRLTLARAENLLASLGREVDRVVELKKEALEEKEKSNLKTVMEADLEALKNLAKEVQEAK